MKSKTEKALVIILSLLLIIIAYKIIYPKVKNVFDEMYYGEKKVYSWFGETPFWDIPGIHRWNRNDMKDTTIRENPIVAEQYENKYKTKELGEWGIHFSFNFETKDIAINFSTKIIKEKLYITFNYYYEIDKKMPREEISLYDDKLPRENARIEDIPRIKEYLEKNNISIKDLKETADELLYEKVIGDWKKYANSRFSKDNLGNVKIERSPLFDGAD